MNKQGVIDTRVCGNQTCAHQGHMEVRQREESIPMEGVWCVPMELWSVGSLRDEIFFC